jgi:hypothetical protein
MRSFEYGYYLETPLSHALLMTMRSLGEFRGRQTLYADQFPEVLTTLRRVAIVQSTESSNRCTSGYALQARFCFGHA